MNVSFPVPDAESNNNNDNNTFEDIIWLSRCVVVHMLKHTDPRE